MFYVNIMIFRVEEEYDTRKCRKAEYVQRSVCFVNVQVRYPHFNIYVKLMSSLLLVRAWVMLRILYLLCGVPFPVWTADNISDLVSVVLWLLRWEVKKSGNILSSGGGANHFFEVVFVFKVIFTFEVIFILEVVFIF